MISRIFFSIAVEVLRRERLVAEEVVVEAVLDHRPDGDLGAGPQRLHGFGQHVRAVVADQLQRARVLAGEEFDLGVALDRVGEVGERAVERHRDRALGERGRDALGDVETGDAVGIVPTRAVGKGQRDHHSLLLLTRCLRTQVSACGSDKPKFARDQPRGDRVGAWDLRRHRAPACPLALLRRARAARVDVTADRTTSLRAPESVRGCSAGPSALPLRAVFAVAGLRCSAEKVSPVTTNDRHPPV